MVEQKVVPFAVGLAGSSVVRTGASTDAPMAVPMDCSWAGLLVAGTAESMVLSLVACSVASTVVWRVFLTVGRKALSKAALMVASMVGLWAVDWAVPSVERTAESTAALRVASMAVRMVASTAA